MSSSGIQKLGWIDHANTSLSVFRLPTFLATIFFLSTTGKLNSQKRYLYLVEVSQSAIYIRSRAEFFVVACSKRWCIEDVHAVRHSPHDIIFLLVEIGPRHGAAMFWCLLTWNELCKIPFCVYSIIIIFIHSFKQFYDVCTLYRQSQK